MRLINILFFLLHYYAQSQVYTYSVYLNDNNLVKTFGRFERANKTDSIKANLNKYKNRLGFSFYKFAALTEKENTVKLKYIDSAFMHGSAPLCFKTLISKEDSLLIYNSYRRNYLGAYNKKLIKIIDSLYNRDQQCRVPWMAEEAAFDSFKSKISIPSNTVTLPALESTQKYYQKTIDSLARLVAQTDSSNFEALKKIVSKYGWPSAKLIGESYCNRPAADASIIIMHLGTTNRGYQIETLKKVIELCKKNEDSWQTAENLIFNLHQRFRKNFSEFSFLEIKNNHLNTDESLFSLFTMTTIMMQLPRERIEIKCKSVSLFNELKKEMLKLNVIISEINRKQNAGAVAKLEDSNFFHIKTEDISDDLVQYKINLK